MSRIAAKKLVVPFVNDTRLLCSVGMTGATRNIYFGLAEFVSMSFLLHFLRPSDVFVDVGANVGVYTVLAAGVCGAEVIAFEPIPANFVHLLDNININRIGHLVGPHCTAVGSCKTRSPFAVGVDPSTCRVATAGDDVAETIEAEIDTLDNQLQDIYPTMIKLDIEGFEGEALAGASKVLSLPALKAVIVELAGHGLQYGYTDDDVHRTLVSKDFARVHYNPFNRQLCPGGGWRTSGDKNAIYIRDWRAASKRLNKAKAFQVLGKTV